MVEIHKYKYSLFAEPFGESNFISPGIGCRIQLYHNDEVICILDFWKDGYEMRPSRWYDDQPTLLTYKFSHLEHVLDMLRNESPVYYQDRQAPASITTEKEGVGENEDSEEAETKMSIWLRGILDRSSKKRKK